MLCSIGIQEMHISRAVGHELIKVADSICILVLQPPHLHLKLKVICMHTVRGRIIAARTLYFLKVYFIFL